MLKGSFSEYAKILPHPREFDHHFLPQGRVLDKKICPGHRDSLAQKHFPRGCLGMYPVGIDRDIKDKPAKNWLRLVLDGAFVWLILLNSGYIIVRD